MWLSGAPSVRLFAIVWKKRVNFEKECGGKEGTVLVGRR